MHSKNWSEEFSLGFLKNHRILVTIAMSGACLWHRKGRGAGGSEFFLCQGLRQHYGGVSSQISSITWKKDLLKMSYCTFFLSKKVDFLCNKNSCSFSIEGTWLATSILTSTSLVEASQALIEKKRFEFDQFHFPFGLGLVSLDTFFWF